MDIEEDHSEVAEDEEWDEDGFEQGDSLEHEYGDDDDVVIDDTSVQSLSDTPGKRFLTPQIRQNVPLSFIAFV